jgi:hypothetical protein
MLSAFFDAGVLIARGSVGNGSRACVQPLYVQLSPADEGERSYWNPLKASRCRLSCTAPIFRSKTGENCDNPLNVSEEPLFANAVSHTDHAPDLFC